MPQILPKLPLIHQPIDIFQSPRATSLLLFLRTFVPQLVSSVAHIDVEFAELFVEGAEIDSWAVVVTVG